MAINAVLFDFNGVIIDDEPVHSEAWREVLNPLGLTYTDEEYYGELLGVPDADFLRRLVAKRGSDLTPLRQLELLDAKTRIYSDLVRHRPVDLPGLPAFVRDLAAHVPLAVVSGALRPEIEWHLQRLEIADCFVTMLGAGEYSAPKPDPAPYLEGLGALTGATGKLTLPAATVVFEDSIHGVNSALAAGMPVLGVTARIPAERLAGCFAHAADFSDLSFARLVELLEGTRR